ncbi:MAG: hypothetical protein GC192_05350 [Bacteroidetes bacterium]|nr:hypothetical protein [Bacteroidota bacterium]
MKSSAFVLLLSLLANLSFASFSKDSLTVNSSYENMDTAHRESLKISLVGDWTKISQDDLDWGFSSLSLFADGKFKGITPEGQAVCGHWEVSNDGEFIAIHNICEKTGEKTGTMLAQVEMADGHTMTLKTLGAQAGKQTFIQ